MQDNVLALVYSFAFIIAVIALAFVLYRTIHLSSESVRKIIHIGVSNWVFILVWCFDDVRFAVVGPVAFIILNAVFVHSGAAGLLGMGDRRRDNGLVYFPFSLLVMTLLYYRGLIQAHDVIAATLVMGYGDGLAALVGSKIGRHRYSVLNASKSWEGTAVMFVVSSLVIALFTPYPALKVLVMAVVATLFEALTPLGLDNITVPLLTALSGALI